MPQWDQEDTTMIITFSRVAVPSRLSLDWENSMQRTEMNVCLSGGQMPYNPTWVPLDTQDSVGLSCPVFGSHSLGVQGNSTRHTVTSTTGICAQCPAQKISSSQTYPVPGWPY